LLVLALVIAGCGGDDDSTTGDTAAAAPQQSTAEKPKIAKPSGAPPDELVVNDIVEGTGDEATAGDEVTVDYVGVNYKSGEEFDASWSRNEPFAFPLGAGAVIQGWDQGVEGMKVGGRRELVIPPELAYGPAGQPPTIPPNETLIFVVDLRKVG
jgi:peptidylprolyl isomerase